MFFSLEYIGVELVGHMVTMFLTFWGTTGLFQSFCTILHSERQCMRAQFLHILTNTCYFVFSILGMLVCVKWYHIMVLICIFSWLMMLRSFSCAYWPFIYLPWRNVYRDPLPILKLDYLFLLWSCRVFLCSRYKYLIRYSICKYYFPFYGLSFYFLMVSFEVQKFKFWLGDCTILKIILINLTWYFCIVGLINS